MPAQPDGNQGCEEEMACIVVSCLELARSEVAYCDQVLRICLSKRMLCKGMCFFMTTAKLRTLAVVTLCCHQFSYSYVCEVHQADVSTARGVTDYYSNLYHSIIGVCMGLRCWLRGVWPCCSGHATSWSTPKASCLRVPCPNA